MEELVGGGAAHTSSAGSCWFTHPWLEAHAAGAWWWPWMETEARTRRTTGLRSGTRHWRRPQMEMEARTHAGGVDWGFFVWMTAGLRIFLLIS
jgi:hypothetical protein